MFLLSSFQLVRKGKAFKCGLEREKNLLNKRSTYVNGNVLDMQFKLESQLQCKAITDTFNIS